MIKQGHSSETVINETRGNVVITTEQNVSINRSVNHNERAIMEDTWSEIKYKANKIDIQPTIGIHSLILGAAIPYFIDIMIALFKHETPDYFPLFACVLLYFIVVMLSHKYPQLRNGNIQENKVHLDDLRRLIRKVDDNDQA